MIPAVSRRRLTMATEPLLRALSRMRGHLLDPEALVRAVASGAQRGGRVPDGRRSSRAPRGAALRRPQGRAPPPGHVVRRHPGAHDQRRRRRRGQGRGRRPARPAVRQLARRHHHPDPPGAGHQEARGGHPHPGPGHPRRGRARARQGQAAPARRGRPGAPGARASPTRRAGSSRPGRRSTARSRSSCGCSTRRSATRWPRASCAPRPRTTRCGSSTSAAATPT